MRSPDMFFFWEKDCPHCKRAYPAVKKALRFIPDDISFTMFNINDDQQLAKIYDVEGTPTLVMTRKNYGSMAIPGVLTARGYLGFIERFVGKRRI